MMMKTLVAMTAGLGLASGAHASTITFKLVKDTLDGTTVSVGKYAVFASVSQGDNRGLAAYNFTLANTTSVTMLSPFAKFDTADHKTSKEAGFNLQVSADNDNPSFASQNTTGASPILAFYIGQQNGNLTSLKPTDYVVANDDRAAYKANVLLANGAYAGGAPSILEASGNVFANLPTNGAPLDTLTVAPDNVTILNTSVPEPLGVASIGLIATSLIRRRRVTA